MCRPPWISHRSPRPRLVPGCRSTSSLLLVARIARQAVEPPEYLLQFVAPATKALTADEPCQSPRQAPPPECRTSPPYRPTCRIRPFPAVRRRPASLEPQRRPLLHERDECNAPASLTSTARAGLLLLLTTCPRPSSPRPNSVAPAGSGLKANVRRPPDPLFLLGQQDSAHVVFFHSGRI